VQGDDEAGPDVTTQAGAGEDGEGTGAQAVRVDDVRRPGEGAQPADGATYAAKIHKAEAIIDWKASAADIDRQVRAFDPVPGASTRLAGERVKLWRAHPVQSVVPGAAPGTVLATEGDTIVVACGDGALEIAELQPAGGRRMNAAAFAAGHRLAPDARFGADAP